VIFDTSNIICEIVKNIQIQHIRMSIEHFKVNDKGVSYKNDSKSIYVYHDKFCDDWQPLYAHKKGSHTFVNEKNVK